MDANSFVNWCAQIQHPCANYYQVLSIASFESDPQTIRKAKQACMRAIWQHVKGPHGDQAQFARERVMEASACLTDPIAKAEYDAFLRHPTVRAPASSAQTAFPNASVRRHPSLSPGSIEALCIAGTFACLLCVVAIGWTTPKTPQQQAAKIAVSRELVSPGLQRRNDDMLQPDLAREPTSDTPQAASTIIAANGSKGGGPHLRPADRTPQRIADLVEDAPASAHSALLRQTKANPVSLLKQSVVGLRSIDVSTDGRQLLTGAWDRTVRLWDLETGVQLRQFTEITESVYDVDLSPDGQLVAAALADGSVLVWNTDQEQGARPIAGHAGAATRVVFSHAGNYLASVGADGTIIIRTMPQGAEVFRLKMAVMWLDAAFSFDDQSLLTASHDGRLVLWSVETGHRIAEFKGHHAAVHSIAFIPRSRLFVSASHDETTRLWSLDSEMEVSRFVGAVSDTLCVAASPDGKNLLTGGEDGSLRVWDILNGRQIYRLEAHENRVGRVVYISNSANVLSAGWDDSVRHWTTKPVPPK